MCGLFHAHVASRHIVSERQRERERDRQTERERQRQRETERERERQRDRETERGTERDRERQRETERDRETRETQRATESRHPKVGFSIQPPRPPTPSAGCGLTRTAYVKRERDSGHHTHQRHCRMSSL